MQQKNDKVDNLHSTHNVMNKNDVHIKITQLHCNSIKLYKLVFGTLNESTQMKIPFVLESPFRLQPSFLRTKLSSLINWIIKVWYSPPEVCTMVWDWKSEMISLVQVQIKGGLHYCSPNFHENKTWRHFLIQSFK